MRSKIPEKKVQPKALRDSQKKSGFISRILHSRVEIYFAALIIGTAALATLVSCMALVVESQVAAATVPDYAFGSPVMKASSYALPNSASGSALGMAGSADVAQKNASPTGLSTRSNPARRVLGANTGTAATDVNTDGLIIPNITYKYVSTQNGEYVYSISYTVPSSIDGASLEVGHKVVLASIKGTNAPQTFTLDFTLLPDYRYRLALFSDENGGGVFIGKPVWITTPPL